jgi:hypothetical protein
MHSVRPTASADDAAHAKIQMAAAKRLIAFNGALRGMRVYFGIVPYGTRGQIG